MNNATLNIQVRVIGRQAVAQLNAVAGAVGGVNAAAARGGGIGALGRNFHTAMKHGEKFGKNLQWVGRQLTWNFTIPIGIAGYAATKWALENEKAMTKVRKVYGDLSFSNQRVKAETDALAKTFELLSSRFGEHQGEVIEVGAAWAAAGSAGVGLAKNVRSTLEASIIGEMDLNTATEALIATMAAYGLTADELGDSLSILNIIENETAAQFSDLIQVIQRAAGAARTGGVDIRYLAAMAAQLVPATGNAARAGSALRTVISRIMSPTDKAAEELNRLGLEVDTLGWTSLNFIQRMERMAGAWDDLTNSEKAYITSTIASRWQVNRFDVLMRGFIDTQSFYKKALEASSDQTRNNTVYQKELLAVLESNPRKLKIMSNVLKNELTKAMVPLLPAIVGIVGAIAKLAHAFGNLDPNVQKLILSALLFLAIIGPLAQYLGAVTLLFSQLGLGAMFAGKGIWWVAKNVFPMFGFVATKVLDVIAFAIFNLAGFIPRVLGGALVGTAKMFGALGTVAYRVFGLGGMVHVALSQMASFVYLMMMRALSPIYAYIRFLAIGIARMFMGMASAIITTTVNWSNIFLAIHARTAATTAGFWTFFRGFWLAIWRFAAVVVATWGSWMVTYNRRVALLVQAMWLGSVRNIGLVFKGLLAVMLAPFRFLAGVLSATITTVANWSRLFMAIFTRTAAGATGAWSLFKAFWVTLWRFSLVAVRTFASLAVRALGRLPLVLVRLAAAAVSGIATALGVSVGWIIAAVVAVIAAIVILLNRDLRNGFIDAIRGIVQSMGQLPGAVARTFHNVVRVIAAAMRAIIEWLSYLNPFARHSPSLVDNVRAGVATILDEYARLRHIPAIIRQAAAAHDAFMQSTSGARAGFQQVKINEQRAIVSKHSPQSVGAFDTLMREADRLEAQLPVIKQQIIEQTAVVRRLADEVKKAEERVDAFRMVLDAASEALEAQEEILSSYEQQLSDVRSQISDVEDALSRLAETPLVGMRAMEDQIFANELAQKKLRLEILKLEKAQAEEGETVDELRDKYAALSGLIETLRADRTELRLAGAGSDVLGGLDAQIAQLEAQRNAMEGALGSDGSGTTEIDRLRKELEELEREGEILDLEKWINFEPQLRQIDQLVNKMKEMTLDQILSQIREQQDLLDGLRDSEQEIIDKIKEQEEVVDQARKKRDLIQKLLDDEEKKLEAINDLHDIEKDKLSQLENAYSDIVSLIQDMRQAMSDFVSEAEAAEAALKRLAGDDRPEFGDYEVPGGDSILGAEGGLADIEEFNRLLEEELSKVLGDMDIFKPIKDAWNTAWQWIKDSWNGIKDWLTRNLSLEGLGNIGSDIWDGIKNGFSAMGDAIVWVWQNLIYPVFKAIVDFVAPILGPVFQVLGTVVSAVWNAIGAVISWIWNTIIKPVWDAMVGFVTGFLIPIFTLFKTIVDIAFTAIGKVIGWVWLNVIKPVWDAIYGWLQDKLPGAFTWLKDNGKKAFEALGTALAWVNDNVIQPVWNGIKWAIENVVEPAFGWLGDRVGQIWNGISSVISTIWNTIAGAVETGLNGLVNAFNIIAGAVNAIAEFVGASSRVSEMSRVSIPRVGAAKSVDWGGLEDSGLAAGGMMTPWGKAPFTTVGSGFVTDGVRAIVGEGSSHPEYVIPTDPRYRDRAMGLYEQLGSRLFAKGGVIPALGFGDIIGGIVDAVDPRKALDEMAEKLTALVGVATGAIGNAKNMIAGLVPEPIRAAGGWMAEQALSWVTSQAMSATKSIFDAVSGLVTNPVGTIVGAIGGGGGGGGGSALSRVRSALISGTYITSTYRTPEYNARVGGAPNSYHMDRNNPAVDIGGSTSALDRLAPKLRAMGGWREFLWRTKGHYDHIHVAKMGDILDEMSQMRHPIDLATGGRIRRRAGGTLLRVGEGRHDEEVQVLPVRGGGDGDGPKTFNFYGDLSFPNITDPDDAEEFIRNLESLV